MTESARPPRRVSPRGWTTLTAGATALGLTVAGPALALSPAEGGKAAPERLWLVQAQTEAGEGGEGGEAGVGSETPEVVELLTDLGLIEGKLRAAVALYRAGLADPAADRLVRPDADAYDEVSYHLEEAGSKGFADELTMLAAAIDGGKSAEEVEAALAEVLHEIDEAREHAGASEAAEAQAMTEIVRHAAEDFADYLADLAAGDKPEPDEYQDAWGYLATARAQAAHMAGEDDAAEKAFGEKALAAIDEAATALPDVSPDGQTLGDVALLHSAAATIELAAYKLK